MEVMDEDIPGDAANTGTRDHCKCLSSSCSFCPALSLIFSLHSKQGRMGTAYRERGAFVLQITAGYLGLTTEFGGGGEKSWITELNSEKARPSSPATTSSKRLCDLSLGALYLAAVGIPMERGLGEQRDRMNGGHEPGLSPRPGPPSLPQSPAGKGGVRQCLLTHLFYPESFCNSD